LDGWAKKEKGNDTSNYRKRRPNEKVSLVHAIGAAVHNTGHRWGYGRIGQKCTNGVDDWGPMVQNTYGAVLTKGMFLGVGQVRVQIAYWKKKQARVCQDGVTQEKRGTVGTLRSQPRRHVGRKGTKNLELA